MSGFKDDDIKNDEAYEKDSGQESIQGCQQEDGDESS